jgi:hypothetical protein
VVLWEIKLLKILFCLTPLLLLANFSSEIRNERLAIMEMTVGGIDLSPLLRTDDAVVEGVIQKLVRLVRDGREDELESVKELLQVFVESLLNGRPRKRGWRRERAGRLKTLINVLDDNQRRREFFKG